MGQINIGQHVKCLIACGGRLVAAGTGDNTKVTGTTIDRRQTQGIASSLVLAVGYSGTIANTKTLSFAVERQQSSDGTTWDTAEVIQAETVAVTSTADGAYSGVVEFDQDLAGCKQFVRYNVTPNLSAAGTDTAEWHAVAVLGGTPQIPV